MSIKKPLYKIIYDDIVSNILSGHYEVGEQLPSEAELDKLYKVSRTPVRNALSLLESDKYIYRLQGRGSFVAKREPIEFWTKMTGFKKYYQDKWDKISAKTLSIDYETESQYAELLNIKQSVPILHLKRVRYLEDEEVVYLKHYLHPRIPISIFEHDYHFTYLGRLLKDHLQIEIVKSDEEIESVYADREISSILHVPLDAPVLKVTRISYDQDFMPVDVNVYFVDTNKWKYNVSFVQEEFAYEDI